MKSLDLTSLHESYPVALYDMSIRNVAERREKRLVFKRAVDAANFLGYAPNRFYSRIGIGKFATHKITGVQYAVRKIEL